MGLSNFLKIDALINLIGKKPGLYTILSILLIGLPIVFAVLYFFGFLDTILYTILKEEYNIESDFVLIKHPVTCGLNTLASIAFIQASFHLYKDRKNQKMLFITSLMFSTTALFGLYVTFFKSILFSISLSTYIWTVITNNIVTLIKIVENIYLSFESKFYLKYLDNVKKNLNERGFNAYVNELSKPLEDHQITNIVITCTEEYYNNIHKILLKFCNEEETAKLLIGFLLENKLTIKKGYIYKESTDTVMTSKEISSLFQEYVKDTKRVISAKEFLNVEHL